MNETPACPTCRAPIPAGSPGGVCPRCLLAAGLEDDRAGAPPAEEVARDFPGFDVLETLGQGGMGVVYKARQRSLDRLVALKVLPPEVAREPGFAERFQREARTLARLQHPHIVAVHEFGSANGLYFLVMEYVDGPNLRQVILDGKLEPRQALAIVPQICDALQYAHDRGVVHRDVKPENVLLDREGNVKIADFGLAKLVQRAPVDVTLTRDGQVMGTVQYMAPEQYRAPDSVDHRADIYSLGVVFYEMLTGDLPVGTFPRPSTRVGVDARLDDVVLRALERERDRRWQQASEIRRQVDSIVSGTIPTAPAPAPGPVSATSTAVPPAATSPGPRTSILAVLGAFGVPAAIGVGFLAGLATAMLDRDVRDKDATMIAVLVGGLVGVAGFVMSLVAWVKIRNSDGRLRGRGFAIVGTLLPVLLPLVLGGLYVLTEDAPRYGPMTLEALREAERVAGGPPMAEQDKWRIAREVERLWAATIPLLEREPNLDVRASLLAPSGRSERAAMTSEEREQSAARNRLGVPFAVISGLRPLTRFRLVWVALDETGTRARAVFSNGGDTFSFPVLREDGRWYAALGLVQSVPRAPLDGDRSGWLDERFVPPGRDPAERVSGRAGMSAIARADVLDEVDRAWRRASNGWVGPAFDLSMGLAPTTFRVFHVALDESGDAGRLVIAARATTVAMSIRREASEWKIESDMEFRRTVPRAEDRDGWLFR